MDWSWSVSSWLQRSGVSTWRCLCFQTKAWPMFWQSKWMLESIFDSWRIQASQAALFQRCLICWEWNSPTIFANLRQTIGLSNRHCKLSGRRDWQGVTSCTTSSPWSTTKRWSQDPSTGHPLPHIPMMKPCWWFTHQKLLLTSRVRWIECGEVLSWGSRHGFGRNLIGSESGAGVGWRGAERGLSFGSILPEISRRTLSRFSQQTKYKPKRQINVTSRETKDNQLTLAQAKTSLDLKEKL